ncbi:metallophosphoesterase [Sediminitomix flava]|uniref:Calcineurin-like phosphoesterase domain-containing protein n=1 Tax=Sediminitomix flava TaxID=379075 RepID=A0A316A3Q9_SEDFL|nr:metallophosphoesterase [Sediminitomix flava]PWJ44367.1 hypothetical protein BC781_101717 [Sediminitomix flava]
MKERVVIFVSVVFVILFLLDLYSFKGVKLLAEDISKKSTQGLLLKGYWVFNVFIYLLFVAEVFLFEKYRVPGYTPYFFIANALIMMSIFSKLIFVLFHGANDLVYWTKMIGEYLFSAPKVDEETATKISRGKFLTYVGAGLAAVPAGAFLYGMLKGRYDFRVIKKTLSFDNLPKAFDGLKVVQISDIHIGSFPKGHPSVQRAVEQINELEPDVILFTGDLVNNLAIETDGWVDVMKQMKAKYGKYSILGNHDYGMYVPWENKNDQIANFDAVKQANRDMGFDLLLDENRVLEKDGERIGILGVENWGEGFLKKGDLNKALSGTEGLPFKMLLSHDPSHWDAQVRDTDIDVTLSGHTHGMQFGIEIPGIKWSPVKYRYPRWAGLYQEGKQFLYVNRGFGYHAYAGRIGMAPEITELTLTKA